VRHDPVPPQYPNHVGLVIEHVLFEPAHQEALLRRIGFAQHLFIKLDLTRIVVVAVVLAVDRGRQGLLHIEKRVDHAMAGASRTTSKSPLRIASNHGPDGRTRCLTWSPILLHSSISQVATYLKGWSTLRLRS